MRVMREKFDLCSVVTASDGPKLRDLDGHWTLDVSGSYGVNVAGFERYKEWIQKGWERVKELGPVLGPLHPDGRRQHRHAQIDFEPGRSVVSHERHRSRYGRGAPGAVQYPPKVDRVLFRAPITAGGTACSRAWAVSATSDDCLTLKELHPASLDVIRRRAKEIAGVLVNPVQSFHPNSPPPNDAVLLTSDMRKTQDSTERYAQWLRQLREMCSACDIPLIFDEVYTGFRLAPGGAQEYFGVQRGYGRLRQNSGGWHADRRGVRQERAHAAFRSRASHAHRLCHRHVFGPSRGDGSDERILALGDAARDGEAL